MRKSEEKLKLILQASDTGWWHWDFTTDVLEGDAKVKSIVGIPPDQPIESFDHVLQRACPEDRPRLRQHAHDLKTRAGDHEVEFCAEWPDGSTHWILVKGRSFEGKRRGRPVRAMGVALDITPRKKAEEALRASEERYRLVNRATNDVIWDWEIVSDDLFWNEAIETTFGYRLADVPRTIDWWYEHVHPDDRGRVMSTFQAAIHNPADQFWTDEYRFLHKNQGWITVLDRGFIARDVNGRAVRMIGSMLDLTGRKRAEEAVRRSEEKFRAIFERAGVGMGRVSFKDARWIDVNDAFCRMLGYTSAELLATPWPQITHPDDLDHDLVPFRRMAAGELDQYEVEKRFVHKTGRHVWARLTLSLVRDALGRPDYEIAIIENITDRKEAEEAVRRSEQRLQATFDNAGVGIVEVEADNRFIAANNLACQILGRTREQLLSMNVHELTWPEDRDLSDRVNGELQAGLFDRIDYEKRYIRGDGSPVWAHVTVSAIRDSERRWVRSIATIEDITDRKRAEEELAAARQSAERAKAAAEHANRAKDHFLAVLSHELRTPLTPVVMGVSMLQDIPDLDSRVRETIEMVRQNVEMEARLIDDLLDVTRISRGKIELKRNPVDLCTVVQRAVEVCRPDIEARKLAFNVDMGAAPYWVNADASRLQQVFWNLLKNAIKFTPHGGRIGVRCGSDDGQVHVEVSDSGIGIEPDALPRVFNAFEQAERSITRQFGGLGLGLAISKALVGMHGGEIEAESRGRNRGATFRVRLPLYAPAGRPQPPVPAGVPQRPVRPLRILLVEDHGATAQMIRMVLAEKGHEVEMAGDVATALELAGSRTFDLLLSDLGLPDGSGHDLMRELHVRGHKMPGIALSGYGQEDDIRRSYEAGFAAHLIKPASREAVNDTIAAVAAGERMSFNSGPSVGTEALLFDPDAALQRCFGKREMLEEMVNFFHKDSTELLIQMHAAVRKRDFAELGRAAHRLKGTVVYLGARPATDAARKVERAARSGDPEASAAAVKELEHQIKMLKQTLASYRKESVS